MSSRQLPSPSPPPQPPPPPPRLARKLQLAAASTTITADEKKPTIVSLPLQRIAHSSSNNSSSSSCGDTGRGYERSYPRRRLDGDRVSLRTSLGTHYVYAHVGSPPHRVSLIVDTGSFNLAFPCVGCNRCRVGRQEDFWDPSGSSTASFSGCDSCHGTYT